MSFKLSAFLLRNISAAGVYRLRTAAAVNTRSLVSTGGGYDDSNPEGLIEEISPQKDTDSSKTIDGKSEEEVMKDGGPLAGLIGTMNIEGRHQRIKPQQQKDKHSSQSNRKADVRVEENLRMLSAVKSVAENFTPKDKERTESQLIQRLRDTDIQTQAAKQGSLSSLISEMKFSRSERAKEVRDKRRDEQGSRSEMSTYGRQYEIRSDSDFIAEDIDEKTPRTQRSEGQLRRWNPANRRNQLFGEDRLGLFAKLETETSVCDDTKPPSLWELDEDQVLHRLNNPPPRNGFDEMITWTKDGKMWKFPINNEQGLEDEHQVGFHEHVFLDKHLEFFPKKGPIRHFMELVLNGLSKNPYLTIGMKLEHIDWYKQYFSDKLQYCETEPEQQQQQHNTAQQS